MTHSNNLGFKIGDYALTGMGFIVKISGEINTSSPFCEIWGLEHGFGNVFADELKKIDEETAKELIRKFEKKGWVV